MPNCIYSILRVFGAKEERTKFIEYISKIVPSRHRHEHPLNEDENIHAMIDKCYEYQTWENEKGTFITFWTPNKTIQQSEGYQLHKLFPTLKFIYRSIDEGFPNHCGKWEFNPNDVISDQQEKDLEIINWMKIILYVIEIKGNSESAHEQFQKQLLEKCNNDPIEVLRIIEKFQKQIDEEEASNCSDLMDPFFANDNYFKLTDEELENSPGISKCTTTWQNFRPTFYNNFNYNFFI